MKIGKTVLGLMISIILPAFTLNAPLASAQNNGLQISPARSIFDLNPGSKQQATITVKNNSPTPGRFDVKFRDFTNDEEESGQPKISEEANLEYGLKNWLAGPSSVTLNNNQTRDYALSITVPAGTRTGSYYGMILFADASSGGTAAAIGSLILVNVGPITRQIAIEEFDVKGVAINTSNLAQSEIVIRLKNTGNGYTVPKVKIEILDDKKAVVEIIDANENSGGILPGTVRRYSAKISKQLEPGKAYSAKLTATTEDGKAVTAEKVMVEAPAISATDKFEQPDNSNLLLLAALGAAIFIGIVTVALISRKNYRNNLKAQQQRNIPTRLSTESTHDTVQLSDTPPASGNDDKPISG